MDYIIKRIDNDKVKGTYLYEYLTLLKEINKTVKLDVMYSNKQLQPTQYLHSNDIKTYKVGRYKYIDESGLEWLKTLLNEKYSVNVSTAQPIDNTLSDKVIDYCNKLSVIIRNDTFNDFIITTLLEYNKQYVLTDSELIELAYLQSQSIGNSKYSEFNQVQIIKMLSDGKCKR